MKIGFILPMPTLKIVGGYKKVYEYANFLSSKGNEVTIFFDSNKGENAKGLPKIIVYLLRELIMFNEPSWFKLNKNIKKRNLYSLEEKYFTNFDVVVATAARTSIFVNRLKNVKKVYLIQGYERGWDLSEDELISTYKFPMTKIVISKWLKAIVSKYTRDKVIYIPNGIDTKVFNNKNLLRKRHSISLLYSSSKLKGWNTAWKVIQKLKERYPDLEVNLFGTEERRKEWPKWINYTRRATPEQVAYIMNKSMVFICTSISEGFGLTGLESMLCGCVLVTTDCGGVREYASESNSLISKVNDVEGIYLNVEKALSNRSVSDNLRNESKKLVKTYDGTRSNLLFMEAIQQ